MTVAGHHVWILSRKVFSSLNKQDKDTVCIISQCSKLIFFSFMYFCIADVIRGWACGYAVVALD